MRAFFSLFLLLVFGCAYSQPKNNIQFGLGMYNEGIGSHVKYVQYYKGIYAGILLKGEGEWNIWGREYPNEEKLTLGHPVEYKKI